MVLAIVKMIINLLSISIESKDIHFTASNLVNLNFVLLYNHVLSTSLYTILSIYVFCNKVNHFRAKFISFIILPVPPYAIRINKIKLKGSDHMYFGSKGWYVKELKKLGIRTYEGKN